MIAISLRAKNAVTSLHSYRTFKNFGHKKQPVPLITTIWHGFLTFTLIGTGLNWNRIGTWFFGEDKEKSAVHTE